MSKKTSEDKNSKLSVLRHSAAHVLAGAVLEMFPEAKFGMGPAIENGFYYDFDLPRTLIPEDLGILESKMREIIKLNYPFERADVSTLEAKADFEKLGQTYKVEIIRDLEKENNQKVSIYKSGPFVDLCAGPHLDSTGEINPKAFKLTKISGAYWKGSEKNKQLQRIYGVVFETEQELQDYLKSLEEAEKRDHRKIGKELDLFVFSDLVGKGLPLLTPKGAIIRQELERFITDEETKRGYFRTYTPELAKVDLYKKSGHWDHYQDSMYPPIEVDGEQYVLRPMTCPHQFMIYNSRPRSYRELPIRYAEIAKLYRREQSGELSGLIRVMSFSLVDAHIICRPDQVEEEFMNVVDLVQHGMRVLGVTDFWYRFSKWDPSNKEKYINNPEAWEATQASMKKILDRMNLEYVEAENEAAFYGPKLDVQMRNVNGKEDTAFTIQIDFAMPERFDMSYIDEHGKHQRPMVIHRSSIGCIERTMAFLIEHYAGAFPVWLSPAQTAIIPISEKFNEYANTVMKKLKESGIRVELNDSNEPLGKRIREAEMQKIPYMLIIGEKESASGNVTVRERGKKEQETVKLEDFLERIKEEIRGRK